MLLKIVISIDFRFIHISKMRELYYSTNKFYNTYSEN